MSLSSNSCYFIILEFFHSFGITYSHPSLSLYIFRWFQPGTKCFLAIGDNNEIRENTSIHRSSKPSERTVCEYDSQLFLFRVHKIYIELRMSYSYNYYMVRLLVITISLWGHVIQPMTAKWVTTTFLQTILFWQVMLQWR